MIYSTGWKAEVQVNEKQEICLTPALGSTQTSIQCIIIQIKSNAKWKIK